MSQMILEMIVITFERLKNDVHVALHTQLGDSNQLEQRIDACSRLLLQVNQVSCLRYNYTIELIEISTQASFLLHNMMSYR